MAETFKYPNELNATLFNSIYKASTGSSWYNRQYSDTGYYNLLAGYTNVNDSGSRTKYRSYFKIPGATIKSNIEGANSVPQKITDVTLSFKINTHWSSPGRWDIGIMTSQPPVTVAYNSTGFVRVKEDLTAASGDSYTITIKPEVWGDYTKDKWIVFVQSEARGTNAYGYQEIHCDTRSNAECPTITITHENAYQKMDPPSDLSSNIGIQKINSNITLTWTKGASSDGIQSISGYEIVRSIDGAAFTSLGTVNAVSFTTAIPSSAPKGKSIKYKVRTLGSAGSSYYSSYSNVATVTVNSPPNAPTVTGPTEVTSTAGTVTLTVSPGTDAQGQSVSCWYQNGTSKTKITESTVTLNAPSAQGSSITYSFYTYDGLEYSSAKTFKVTKNMEIKGTISSTPSEYTGMIPSGAKCLTNKLSFSFSKTAGDPKTYSWFFQTSNTSTISDGNTKTTIGSNTSYSEHKLTNLSAGRYFRLGVTITDKLTGEPQKTFYDSNIYYSPKKPSGVVINDLINDLNESLIDEDGNEVSPWYFNNEIKLTFTNPEIVSGSGQCNIDKLTLIYIKDGSTTVSISNYQGTNLNSKGQNKIDSTYNDNSTIERNNSYKIGIRLEDTAGQTVDSTTVRSYKRASAPSFTEEVSLRYDGDLTVHPYQKTAVSLETPYATTGSYNELIYKTYIHSNNKSFDDILVSEVTTSESEEYIPLLSQTVLSDCLFNTDKISDKNTLYPDCEIKVYAIDAFGLKSNPLTKTGIEIEYKEAPIIKVHEDAESINIKVVSNGKEVNVFPSSANETRVFFPGEIIEFTNLQYTDVNGYSDVSKYYLYTWESSQKVTEFEDNLQWGDPIAEIEVDKTAQEGAAKSFTYSFPNNPSEVKFIYFKITVKDTKGLESNSLEGTDLCLIRGIRTNPSIALEKVEVDSNKNLKYSYKITDGGYGNIPSDNIALSYQTQHYFERYIGNSYTGKAEIFVQYSETADFSDQTQIETSNVLYPNENNSSSVGNKLFNIINKNASYLTNWEINKKFYIRLYLKIYTSIDSSNQPSNPVEAYSNALIFYPFSSTLQLRQNYVGINMSSFGNNELFAISPADEHRDKIIFYGVKTGQQIIIDLASDVMTISGATISGGTWDPPSPPAQENLT